MRKARVLFISSEIHPYLELTEQSKIARYLPQGIQERGKEIRTFMPKFGNINERRNQLHEVIRLSGMNLIIDDSDHPLIIKVASIPNAKLQVYFIDNEDYFHRKSMFHDKENKFYEDNDERAIFFCKGVIETVRKLGWTPDIVHCNDWITSFIPLYLKTTYKNDPLFKNTKSVFTIYNNSFTHKFKGDLMGKVKMMDIEDNMLGHLKTADYEGFVKLGAQFADVVSVAGDNKKLEGLVKKIKEKKVETIEKDDNYTESFYNLYTELAG